MSADYETVLLVKNDVNVFRIPPRQSNRSYRAADWNLQAPDWKGRMRVVAKSNALCVKLEDVASGELFAKCPVDTENPGQAVEGVSDSSRYFVLRIQDDNGRTAFIGIGFTDRGDSFDLNVVIQEHIKQLRNEAAAEEEVANPIPQPSLDLRFKEGQTITLQLNTRKNAAGGYDVDDLEEDYEPSQARQKSREALAASGVSIGSGLLPPPPTGGRVRGRSPDRRGPSPTPATVVAAPPASTNSAGISNFDLLGDLG